MSKEIELTPLEERILQHLHSRAEQILGKNHKSPISPTLFNSVISMCNVMYLPKFFSDVNPEEAANAVQSLLCQGLVKEYQDKMMPSFVPISYCQ